jgi:hypothetical protein
MHLSRNCENIRPNFDYTRQSRTIGPLRHRQRITQGIQDLTWVRVYKTGLGEPARPLITQFLKSVSCWCSFLHKNLAAAKMLIVVFWFATSCNLVDGYQPEDRCDTFLRNIRNHLQENTASQPRRPQSTFTVGINSFITIIHNGEKRR